MPQAEIWRDCTLQCQQSRALPKKKGAGPCVECHGGAGAKIQPLRRDGAQNLFKITVLKAAHLIAFTRIYTRMSLFF